MKTLRVCIFTETYTPVVGGGETQARLLADGLVAAGHSAIVLTRRSDASLPRRELIGAVTVHRLPPAGRGQLKKWGLLFTSLPALVRLRGEFDLVFVSGFRIIGVAAVIVCRLFRKRCVLKADSQGEMSGDFFNNGLRKLGVTRAWLPFRWFLGLRNLVLKGADAFCAITDEIAAEYAAAGVRPQQIHRIPNSVDIARFKHAPAWQKQGLRARLGLPLSSSCLVYTGRLVSYKGLPLLLRVWKEICRWRSDLHLVLVGSGGLDMHNCEVELKTFVRENGLESSVSFPGSVQNVPDYLQAADIFVFPTEEDAFPSAVIEAMACALPVIATPVGAIKTILTDGRDGLIVPPGDFDALTRAIERLLSDPALASRLGQAACERVREVYSAGRVTEKYMTIFQDETV